MIKLAWEKGQKAVVFTLFSPSMTMTGTEVAGQRCLAGRGLSQFHSTITCTRGIFKTSYFWQMTSQCIKVDTISI